MPLPRAGLLVDRLAWDRRAGEVSFSVEPGARVYVCGDDAASLLLALGGFLPVRSGRVVCDGRDLTGVAPASRHLAYIPGGDSLIGRHSLLANVAVPGAGRAAAAASLDRLGLLGEMSRPAATLSPGQRRLGALARALAAQPALLLVQEAHDDPPTIPERLATVDRPAALIATTSAGVALARAARILLLHGGKADQFASPQDLYQRPATGYAATWSGACNLVPATLEGAGPVAGSVLARVGGHLLAARFRDRATGPASLAVRPHQMRLVQPGGDLPSLPATVRTVDYQGASTRLTLSAADTTLLLDTAEPDGLVPGQTLHVTWRWSDAWPVPVPVTA